MLLVLVLSLSSSVTILGMLKVSPFTLKLEDELHIDKIVLSSIYHEESLFHGATLVIVFVDNNQRNDILVRLHCLRIQLRLRCSLLFLLDHCTVRLG